VQMEAVAWLIGGENEGRGQFVTDRRDVMEVAKARDLAIIPLYASPVPSSERDTGWLVELKGERPTWWSLTDTGEDAAGWATDASLALRFARKCDAEAYIDDMGWTEAFASEHAWSGA